jgi:CoA:oxalate CoA-transferase|tara:strand:+ start:1 stop:1173 length:1173 start_codon:yes stop_codon:yes gene_type:complete
MEYPLAGLKVLDFSRVLAGPFAGRMLSDLGAEVVKVEPPDGDVTRYWGHEVANITGYFHQQNAGKKNICIDLRAPDAPNLVKQLAANADIVIENYRPDVMDRLGVGYTDLDAVNEKLIMLSISGFGRDGPESTRPAYAPVIHAEAGLIARSTTKDGVKHHDLPLSVADTNASLHGLVGVLAALHMRHRTGKGQHIDIAMIDATVATDDQIHYDLEGSNETGPMPNEIWESGIGPVLLSTDFRLLFRSLTELGLEDPSNPMMELKEKISLRRKAVGDFLNTIDTLEDFSAAMKSINVAWGEVRSPENLRDQKTIIRRGSITDIDDRNGGTRPITQSPYRFSNAKSGVRGPAAHRGEHFNEVLKGWLSMNDKDISQLREDNVVIYNREWRHH